MLAAGALPLTTAPLLLPLTPGADLTAVELAVENLPPLTAPLLPPLTLGTEPLLFPPLNGLGPLPRPRPTPLSAPETLLPP